MATPKKNRRILLAVQGSVMLASTVLAQGGPEGGAWDARFFVPGTDGEVRAIACTVDEILVGGEFTAVGGVPVTNIARWNGTNWLAHGSGINGAVNAVSVRGNEVFAGGTFTQAGGASAGLVARWDGTAWTALGTGLRGSGVNALAIGSAGALYAAGEFTNAGGVAVANIARWDGSNWSALGAGLSNDPYPAWVLALAVRGTELFAGGFFTDAGGVSVSCIARWNGSAWSALGAGVDDRDYLPQVTSLAVSGNDLFVGGAFRTAGNASAAHVARWNGAGWAALGDGLGRFYGDVPVRTLAVRGNELFVGGRFVSAGTGSANNLAVWNGATWAEPAGGVTGTVHALAVAATNLVAGGAYVTSNGLNNLARWDGTRWAAPGADAGEGITGEEVTALATSAAGTFAGGTFTFAGQTPAQNIARWTGAHWSALGSGVNGKVYALCDRAGELFVGGRFTAAGGIAASNIARWDGTNWSALSGGLSGSVYALACSDRELFAGGMFSAAGGLPASNLARWDGTNWHALGIGVSDTVRALAFGAGSLYAGGSFKLAGGINATNIARWDGSSWFALGEGVSGTVSMVPRIRPPPVSALLLAGKDLFVGGDFAQAGNVAATNVARWDGTNWHPLGAGITNVPGLNPPPTVASLGMFGGRLIAGGTFRQADSAAASSLAHWDGTTWLAWGRGIEGGSLLALASRGDELLMGGRFGSAGGERASRFSVWRLAPSLRIARVREVLQVSWSATRPDYVLQVTDSLSSQSWRATTNQPIAVDGQWTVNEAEPAPRRFFRLMLNTEAP